MIVSVDPNTGLPIINPQPNVTVSGGGGGGLGDAPQDGTTYGRQNGAWVDTSGGSGLPDQTGNSGKYLTTDGTDPSWATLAGGGDMATATYDPAGKSEQLLGVSDILDEDTMTSNSATKAPSQQSTKAYVDSVASGKANTSHTHTEADITDLGNYLTTVTASDINAEASTDGQVLTSDGAGNVAWETPSGGGGAVDSVNGATGTVVLDPDDLDDATTLHKFTSAAEISKLAGIEANADVTDTANVTAAGALMDSEVTNLAQVKAFNSADYATAAQGALADSATQPGDLATVATTGAYSDLTGTPTIPTVDDTAYNATTWDLNTDAPTKNAVRDKIVSMDSDIAGKASASHTHTASQVTDFDTEVSNNTDVAANTAARHSAVTVTDSAEIDFTLTGQDITASLKAGSIDETKLDTSTNASLDLADSSVQPGDNISTLTNDSGFTTNTGTVTSVAQTVPTGMTVSGSPITGSGTLALGYDTGYQGYTSAEASKLSGIETGADVTDTANVTAAGALMDSEVDADIKTLSLPANTTISTFGASLIDDASNTAARTTLGLGTAATLASIDEDDMTSDSATALPTQQSVKAYVDALAGLGGIDSQSTSASNGYIRFVSGIQIAWVKGTTASVNNAYGNVYYGDATLGNWGAAFDSILLSWATGTTGTGTIWVTNTPGQTTTDAGAVRAYRPTSTSSTYDVWAIAIGTWS